MCVCVYVCVCVCVCVSAKEMRKEESGLISTELSTTDVKSDITRTNSDLVGPIPGIKTEDGTMCKSPHTHPHTRSGPGTGSSLVNHNRLNRRRDWADRKSVV